MDEHRKQLVSLRGASAKEITRDALLEKVSRERELRNHARRTGAAALIIQKIWRRYNVMKMVAGQLQDNWETLMSCDGALRTAKWVSNDLLRPFLFFATRSSTLHHEIQLRDIKCILVCFKLLLQSINSTDLDKNFCALAFGSSEEKVAWFFQARKIITICSSVLGECDHTTLDGKDRILATALAMRLIVALTDLEAWKKFHPHKNGDTTYAVKDIIRFIASGKSGLYCSIRNFIVKFLAPAGLPNKSIMQRDDQFIITASAITMALRPFQFMKLNADNIGSIHMSEVKFTAEEYCIYFLTIPWLTERLPVGILPALKHVTTLSSCFKTLLIAKENIFVQMSNLNQHMGIPSAAWALANIINLTSVHDKDCSDSGGFVEGLELKDYVLTVCSISDHLLPWLEDIRQTNKKENDEDIIHGNIEERGASGYSNAPFIDLLRPVHQQWHLTRLLTSLKSGNSCIEKNSSSGYQSLEWLEQKLEVLDIVFFYSSMLNIFSSLNKFGGPLPILNILAFTPSFIPMLWLRLESSIMPEGSPFANTYNLSRMSEASQNENQGIQMKKEERVMKDTGNKWASVLQKIKGKSSTDENVTRLCKDPLDFDSNLDDASDIWDIEPLRRGPLGLSKETSQVMHMFCATYAHLLLILDDIEFYEKQVPFAIEQQRKIAALLNTLVYNGFLHNNGQQNKPLMDVAGRCLLLLYERDCRHKFCPTSLWLAPARKNRPPIATAARAHEAVITGMRIGDAAAIPSMGSLITTMPHVFPFDERVQMFREFIKVDKISRRMAGEVAGPGPGSIEVAVRRDHIVEDGFKQLNSLGSRLKSCINVSFVNEFGLPEAGLDYGGLSKEFLTDLAKAAFDPQYGLFSQTSTSERLLIPQTTARVLQNGMQMIEFLGRVVGKALYEGILLDYSFSPVFVQKILGRYSFLDELSSLDPELYRNLMFVKHFEGDVGELALDFTVTEERLGERVIIELKPGGANISVTNENKLQYVHAVADYKLNKQILPLANAFYRGLIDLISPPWLSLFDASEFNQLLSGGEHDFDVDDLKTHTRYTGGYSEGSRTIKLFWEVVREFEPRERCLLLKFVTSCSRAPLLGFKHLKPAFTIHKVACDVPVWAMIGGQDVDRLPSASTCYNTLKLPTYKRSATLRNKLIYAISSNAGFELS
ncbi:E3 ubiquitin-protein ligase UPL7 isoform X1 [Amborella trichopoda]|uniref:E3 ubiquitin-protein ligase UPL7 isoform X1 n=1 Tax=Amborella trichopoda TaxID=13333 RepID=UPI0005D3C870|nr:E3 ubiquitin-protein ligase UPL7 isoform X1 [Amborella trichopoda]|eukprot:XP_011621572.1 E3 ubiquitin-protein ligase UPL7 isoform X1 [Amborella trichopoda]